MIRVTILALVVFLVCYPTGSVYAQWVEDTSGPFYGDPDAELEPGAPSDDFDLNQDGTVSPPPPAVPNLETGWFFVRYKHVVFGIWLGHVRAVNYTPDAIEMAGFCKRTYHFQGVDPYTFRVTGLGSVASVAWVKANPANAWMQARASVQGPNGIINEFGWGIEPEEPLINIFVDEEEEAEPSDGHTTFVLAEASKVGVGYDGDGASFVHLVYRSEDSDRTTIQATMIGRARLWPTIYASTGTLVFLEQQPEATKLTTAGEAWFLGGAIATFDVKKGNLTQ